jgi:hypothetical protein
MAWGDGAVCYVEEVRATKPGWWWPTTPARIQKRTRGQRTGNGSTITKKKDLTCPNKLFRQHLFHQIKKWHKEGDRNILFMDHNEHTYDGPLGRALSDPEGVGLQEAVLRHTGKRTGATFFQGSKPIDGLWVTSDIEIANACVMPFGYGIGDHRMFIPDVTMESLVGKNPILVVHPASRRLNSKMPWC